jgi:2-dehydro-3-deoxygluconokinase
MKQVVILGETLLRLKSPGYERLFQSSALEATFGGAESNVAASLATFGVPVAYASAIPANPIGDACVRDLHSYGIDTRFVRRQGERLGTYYLEAGSNQRPATVVYDRAHSSLATACPQQFDWDEILEHAGWLHVSGIIAGLSEAAATITIDAARRARERGIPVSCDYNHRASLWRYGKSPPIPTVT